MKITEDMLETMAAVILMAESDLEYKLNNEDVGGFRADVDLQQDEKTLEDARGILTMMQAELDSEAE